MLMYSPDTSLAVSAATWLGVSVLTDMSVPATPALINPNSAALVSAPPRLIDVNPTMNAQAYTAGNLLANPTVVTGGARVADEPCYWLSLEVTDEDDQGVPLTIYLLDGNPSFGTIGAAPTITDANARNILARLDIAAADWVDLGGVKQASFGPQTGLGKIVKPASATANFYLAVVNGTGAPTFTANGLRFRVGFG